MLHGVFVILAVGFVAGELASRLRLPRLIGMLVAGIAIGPSVLDLLPQPVLDISGEIRLFTLLVILLKAGLGLDKEKILAQGSVAIRLGFLPAVIEATVVAVATRYIFGWDWISSWLVGWIICAASPAVIVPMMLRLKAEGWGVKKGIPDLILAGGTASDAVAVTMFGIFVVWASGDGDGGIGARLANIPIQIVLGILFGIVAGKLSVILVKRLGLADNSVHEGLVAVVAGLLLVIGGSVLPYSPFLAVMVTGFVILETDSVLARRVRGGMDRVWVVGEIFLFVLIGAAVDVRVIREAGMAGLGVVAIGLLIGRWAGIFASTWRSIITMRERLFMVVGDMAKATVQAAIGGIPLALGLPHGEYMLAIAVVAILVSAPLGAFGTVLLAPRMLEKGEIDPTRVTVRDRFRFLAVTSGRRPPRRLIREAARIARRVDAKLLILNVHPDPEHLVDSERLREELLAARDVDHEVILVDGNITETVVDVARAHRVDHIYLSSEANSSGGHDITTAILENCDIPVMVIGEGT